MKKLRRSSSATTVVVSIVFGLMSLWTASVSRAEVAQADAQQLKALIERGVPVVDIRTPGEWRSTGVIEGSHLLTFFDRRNQFDLDAWMAKFSKIAGPDDPVVLICAAGVRTTAVTKVLDARLNYSSVINVTRGIDDWRRRGEPVVPWTP